VGATDPGTGGIGILGEDSLPAEYTDEVRAQGLHDRTNAWNGCSDCGCHRATVWPVTAEY
jgi:hypothetical protein